MSIIGADLKGDGVLVISFALGFALIFDKFIECVVANCL